MNELMIFDEENKEVKSYAIYYTINERFYAIYTTKEKDENNYVILHIAKVLKEVNNTPEGIVPTGKYIGLEISDQSEWDNAKANIGEIVANKQNNTPTSVTYLPVSEINGISIKSSKTFKLREDVVDSIIVNETATVIPETPAIAEEPVVAANQELTPTSLDEFAPEVPVVDEPAIAEEVSVEPVVSPFEAQPEVAPAVETPFEVTPANEPLVTPAIAPNPFEMQPDIEIPTPVVQPEEQPVNPYEVMQQQRAEEMVNALANDNMQDIVAAPVIPVSELESQTEEPIGEEIVTPVASEVAPVEVAAAPAEIQTEQPSQVIVENNVEPEVTPTIEAPASEVAPVDNKEEVISSESFVDSIVADVSDILDKKEETSPEEKEDYERLYNDALEKTVELEKELAELHNKLNNIKNIIE